MTAEEALERWEVHGDGSHIPSIFRDMGLTRLRILAAEEAKPPVPSPMDRMPVPRLNYNPLDRALGRETPPAVPAPKAEAAPTPAPSVPSRCATRRSPIPRGCARRAASGRPFAITSPSAAA